MLHSDSTSIGTDANCGITTGTLALRVTVVAPLAGTNCDRVNHVLFVGKSYCPPFSTVPSHAVTLTPQRKNVSSEFRHHAQPLTVSCSEQIPFESRIACVGRCTILSRAIWRERWLYCKERRTGRRESLAQVTTRQTRKRGRNDRRNGSSNGRTGGCKLQCGIGGSFQQTRTTRVKQLPTHVFGECYRTAVIARG